MSVNAAVEIPAPEMISDLVRSAMKVHDMRRDRSVQTTQGRLGPSDLGFCRQKATLVAKYVPASDAKSTWPAIVGTALGEYVETALAEAFPGWRLGSVTQQPVSHTFPCGLAVGGTPDIVVPEWNAVLDLKTKDGFSWVKREPWSQNYLYQLSTYALALIDAGILSADRPVTIGLVFIDRSGGEQDPYVVLRTLSPGIEDEIDGWITDVIYAVQQHEDAMRDIPAPVCERICEWFTVCRGGLPAEDSDLITDETLIGAIDMYVEGRDTKAEGERQMDEAKGMLEGVTGTTGVWQVRSTKVGPADIPGYQRAGYTKIDIRRQR
jgi:hypothetical protein